MKTETVLFELNIRVEILSSRTENEISGSRTVDGIFK